MKKRYIILSLALVVLIMGAAIGSTIAYFTTYTYARGGHTLQLGYSTRIKEEFSNYTKHLSISNDEGSVPVFVRAKGFSKQPLEYSDSGDNWKPTAPGKSVVAADDTGWYYYQLPVAGGAATEDALDIKISFPADAEDQDEFTVVAIYEATPVKYDANGNPYADWTDKLEVKEGE